MLVPPCSEVVPTGSQVLGDATPESDYDFLMYVDCSQFTFLDQLHRDLTEQGFTENRGSYPVDDFMIMRRIDKGLGLNVNLIFTTSKTKFAIWQRCDRYAAHAKLDKMARIALYETMIDEYTGLDYA